jgi:hypothetical protein
MKSLSVFIMPRSSLICSCISDHTMNLWKTVAAAMFLMSRTRISGMPLCSQRVPDVLPAVPGHVPAVLHPQEVQDRKPLPNHCQARKNYPRPWPVTSLIVAIFSYR